ncbi:GON-4-like protein, partial [Micropterus dolomieu]|uniref:GON-4-like protein n=1 Tax=Micropterus dolomieu TaxID=147949 RepID=UPI001E8EBDA0
LIVLGLKHFEGTVQSDQLISTYLLCKTRWNFRKHIREMSATRAPHNNVIKMFVTQGIVPPLPLACSRVQPGDQRPPVDRDTSTMPNWLKNSQLIIQKTQQGTTCYPPSLPPGCNLRLHPYFVNKSRPPRPPHRRFFTLAHNASLLPLAKAPASSNFEEQQAFERSRRFLRQLEISFGDNPSHYQKIIKALQTGPDLSPTSIDELKAQMATLLKGHTHLQAEFWVFFDELRPPPARPGQFEEAHWPEEGGGGTDGGEVVGQASGGDHLTHLSYLTYLSPDTLVIPSPDT